MAGAAAMPGTATGWIDHHLGPQRIQTLTRSVVSSGAPDGPRGT